MSGRERIIKMFDSILRFDTFSKYNMTLDKQFKCYSLKNLVNSLKNRPEIEIKDKVKDQLMRIIEKQEMNYENLTNSNKKTFLPFGIQENSTCIFDKNFSPRQKTTITNQEKKFSYLPKLPAKKDLDPFKYHPNYQSIYKNIPCVKFYKPKKLTLSYGDKKTHNRENEIFLTDVLIGNQNNDTKEKIINNLKLNNSNIKSTENIHSMNNSPNNSKTNQQNEENSSGSKKKHKKNKNSFRFNRNNHALRFSKYISRKEKKIEINDRVSYIDPYNYLSKKNNKALDFRKMKERSWKDMINLNTINNPSICHYKPKYEFLETKPINVVFNPSLELKNGRKNKKYLLHKVLSSYYITEDYRLIDNNKLKPTRTLSSLDY